MPNPVTMLYGRKADLVILPHVLAEERPHPYSTPGRKRGAQIALTTGIDALASFAPQIVNPRHGLSRVVQCLGGCENKRHAYFRSISKTPHIRARGAPSVCAVRTVGLMVRKRPPKPIPVQ
ncbi:hypothetical protein [Mycobacterium tuberculosis]|uniref:hypothetical protein n=1 Tax=Mycobacterium tuberculosis TaxID=1773 RepID=UPI00099DD7A5|nr:hypothetical protein [Mycobacterium tuberculosis]